MAQYSVDKLIGKPLTLKKPVPVYRNRTDAKPVYMARAGQSAGIVFSWVTNKQTGDIWLMFYDANKKPYFINTKDLATGAVNLTELKREGVKSTKEVYQEAEKKANPVEYYIKKYGVFVGLGVLGILALRKL